MVNPPKIYGMTTVNSKWQVVIPSEVRSKLNINSGDQFVVVAHDEFWFLLLKADTLEDFIISAKQLHPEAFEQIAQLSQYTK